VIIVADKRLYVLAKVYTECSSEKTAIELAKKRNRMMNGAEEIYAAEEKIYYSPDGGMVWEKAVSFVLIFDRCIFASLEEILKEANEREDFMAGEDRIFIASRQIQWPGPIKGHT
jgi:hypothetical protein